MDDAEIVCAYKHGPGLLLAKWNQTALKRVLERWKDSRSEDYTTIREYAYADASPFMYIDIDTMGDSETMDRFLDYRIDENFLDGEVMDDEGLLEPFEDFAEEFIAELETVVVESKPAMLSPREYAVFVAYGNTTAAVISDTLGISIGTIRGKIGRVRNKIEEADEMLAFQEMLMHFEETDSPGTYVTPKSLNRVTESELPINVTRTPPHFSDEIESFAPN